MYRIGAPTNYVIGLLLPQLLYLVRTTMYVVDEQSGTPSRHRHHAHSAMASVDIEYMYLLVRCAGVVRK